MTATNELILCCIYLICLSSFVAFGDNNDYVPEQIHISKGDKDSEMVIMWTTAIDPQESLVEFGSTEDKLRSTANGTRKALFNLARKQTVHQAVASNLTPSQRYWYRVGSRLGWSRTYDFKMYPKDDDTKWSPRLAVYGDLGLNNGRSIKSLISESNSNHFDMILHIGDISYDLFTVQGRVGDRFMRAIEPIAARIPYMVVPGNHEYLPVIGDSGRNYWARFDMPGLNDDRFVFTLGPARFVGVNTELYYVSEGGNPFKANLQRIWLEKVLQEANLPERRVAHPWLIVLQHRPLYCSNSLPHCPGGVNWIRGGVNLLGYPGLENIYYKNGVDLVIAGHNHQYERMFPVYDKKLMMNPKDPFNNPKAPVYIVTGAPGNKENLEDFQKSSPPWSAIRVKEYGYTKMTVENKTHLYLEQIAVEKNNSLVDSFWLTQENHGPFLP